MEIKLKNKTTIYITRLETHSDITCQWCGKTIKANKPHFWGGSVMVACSAAHVKAAANASL